MKEGNKQWLQFVEDVFNSIPGCCSNRPAPMIENKSGKQQWYQEFQDDMADIYKRILAGDREMNELHKQIWKIIGESKLCSAMIVGVLEHVKADLLFQTFTVGVRELKGEVKAGDGPIVGVRWESKSKC